MQKTDNVERAHLLVEMARVAEQLEENGRRSVFSMTPSRSSARTAPTRSFQMCCGGRERCFGRKATPRQRFAVIR